MTRKRLLIMALSAVAGLAVASSAFGQAPPVPKITTKGDHGQPGEAIVMADPQRPVTWLPEVPGPSFTGVPGARRVKPESDREDRVLTITDGETGKDYRVPYTVTIEAEQTPDGLLHGRAKVPDPVEMEAAVKAAVPADVYDKLQRSKEKKVAKPPGG